MKKETTQNLRTANPGRILAMTAVALTFAPSIALSGEIVVDVAATSEHSAYDTRNDSGYGAAPIDAVGTPGTIATPQPMTYTDPQSGQTYLIPPAPTSFDANGNPVAAFPIMPIPMATPSVLPQAAADGLPADQFADVAQREREIEDDKAKEKDRIASAQASVAAPADAAAPTIDLSKVPRLYVQPIETRDASIDVAVSARSSTRLPVVCNDAEMMNAVFRLQARDQTLTKKQVAKIEALRAMKDPEGRLLYADAIAQAERPMPRQVDSGKKSLKDDAQIRAETQSLLYAGRAEQSLESIRDDLHEAKGKMNARIQSHIAFRRELKSKGSDRVQFGQAAAHYIRSFKKESSDLQSWARSVETACKKYSTLKRMSRSTASASSR